jgi:DNA-binding HxlR family transcriptional regulator
MPENKRRSYCGISTALDIIGDKWSLLIIRDLMFRKKITYGDFLKSEEKIATNILADRLNMLESQGIISKKEMPGSKSKYMYSLTRKGVDFGPVLMELMLWSEKYYEISEKGKALLERIKKDREGLINEILSSLK